LSLTPFSLTPFSPFEELKAVFDPRGGYFKAGGVYMPSIVAEIGAVIEQHMNST
jgi:hypothetical protein